MIQRLHAREIVYHVLVLIVCAVCGLHRMLLTLHALWTERKRLNAPMMRYMRVQM